ncbi:site-specific DNA-methyltransferase (adenine-specific) [Methanohalophilus euhalobius]|jgi:site-specific DNA-methyltransferase (adenine-specific)|uniref:Type II methyltransferase n=1 Tax=Methanohalophilus euhalobius TaxID=51203 RepID=A0A285EWX9_9EURY|nr:MULTISPECIES: site-specific DNA-methyltransferase [Methanohalophilus]ODV50473.1 MAG: modification methylase [Methanohalophilus sp. 2-GBenrich]TCL12807.1 site-specific DNA-methyltransferase (adenine-specific) [Methanohalophilus euhalobius]SNY03568.1 site-specific DNA-methyltransferase (adenine-specific) [Methanohalophilus euhalobius]
MKPAEIYGNVFYNEDCITGAATHIPDGSVDLIITDPPYGIKGDKLHQHYNRNEKFVIDGYVEIPEDKYADFSLTWIKEAERILKPGGSIYIVSGYTNLYHILHALYQTNLEEINHIIWKYNFGVYTKTKYVSSHYHILYYQKPGKRRTFNLESRYGTCEKTEDGRSLNYRDREDVWIINREYKPGKIKNKNELPYKLLKKIIQYSSNEGDLVCDMFLGGFSTATVAIGLNRRCTGFEISETMFRAKTREIGQSSVIKPGFMIPELRKPIIKNLENQGNSWTSHEEDYLFTRYRELRQSGQNKKDIIEIIGEELGRGRWSIEKAIKKMEKKDENRHPQ